MLTNNSWDFIEASYAMIETRTHLHNNFLIQGVSNILLFKVKLLVYSFVPFFYIINSSRFPLIK
jgi:hypothetical protein